MWILSRNGKDGLKKRMHELEQSMISRHVRVSVMTMNVLKYTLLLIASNIKYGLKCIQLIIVNISLTFWWTSKQVKTWNDSNLVPRVFSLSTMAAAGEKTLAHSRNHVTDWSTKSGNLFKWRPKKRLRGSGYEDWGWWKTNKMAAKANSKEAKNMHALTTPRQNALRKSKKFNIQSAFYFRSSSGAPAREARQRSTMGNKIW